MRDFSDIDRMATRDGVLGWLWNVNDRWTYPGCPTDRNGRGDILPVESVADGRVKAALDAGAWVIAGIDNNRAARPTMAVRKAGTSPYPPRSTTIQFTPADFAPGA